MKFLLVAFACLAGLGICSASSYVVYVQTRNAGTRDRVSIKIQGPLGTTSVHDLYPKDGNFNGFSVKRFTFSDSKDVGEPNRILLRIMSRTPGFDDSWIPYMIIVVNQSNKKMKKFYYNQMLPHNQWTSITLKCPLGFQTTSKGKCQDIDECKKSDACKDNAVCQNSIGSFRCICLKGYKKEKYGDGCEDINECWQKKSPKKNGNCEHYCRNTAGSYYCECRWGYKKTGFYNCEDINECIEDSNACDKNSTICENTIPGHRCNCKRGFLPTSDKRKCKRHVCEHALVQSQGQLIHPPSCLIAKTSKHGDVCTTTCKPGWELKDPSRNKQTCDDGIWTPYDVYCTRVKCPPIQPPVNGYVHPDFCSTKGYTFGNRCQFTCHSSYQLRGQPFTHCLANRTWDISTNVTCEKVHHKPWISCKSSIDLILSPGASVSSVSYKQVKPLSNMQDIKISPKQYNNKTILVVPAGTTMLTFVATNELGQTASCRVIISVKDQEKPTLTKPCPSDIYVRTALEKINVSWVPPQFRDNVGLKNVQSSHQPGSVFRAGHDYTVTYTATDRSGNKAECSFSINITRKDCLRNPADPENGAFACSVMLGSRFCSYRCNPTFRPYKDQIYVQCDRNTETWKPKPVDCVEFIPFPPFGKCPSGMEYRNSQLFGKSCQKCPKGMKYDASSTKCHDCPKGFISTSRGSTKCTKCPDGFTTPGPGSKTCVTAS